MSNSDKILAIMKLAASEGWNGLTPEKIESIIEINANSFLAQFTDDSVTMNLQEMFFDHTFLEAIAENTDSNWNDYARRLAEKKSDLRLPWLYKNLLDIGAFNDLLDVEAIVDESRSNASDGESGTWQWVHGTGIGGRANVPITPRLAIRRDTPSVTSFTPRTEPTILGRDVENIIRGVDMGRVEEPRDVNGLPITDNRTRNGCPINCEACAADRDREMRQEMTALELGSTPPVLRSDLSEMRIGGELAPGMTITAIHNTPSADDTTITSYL